MFLKSCYFPVISYIKYLNSFWEIRMWQPVFETQKVHLYKHFWFYGLLGSYHQIPFLLCGIFVVVSTSWHLASTLLPARSTGTPSCQILWSLLCGRWHWPLNDFIEIPFPWFPLSLICRETALCLVFCELLGSWYGCTLQEIRTGSYHSWESLAKWILWQRKTEQCCSRNLNT